MHEVKFGPPPKYEPKTSDQLADEVYGDSMERAARWVLLALGICPEHDVELQRVGNAWSCSKCELEDFHEVKP